MKLVPIRPPGPNARKARAYEADILQLRAQGYTFEAIREALAAAGIHVSNSTVQREVARAAGQHHHVGLMTVSEPVKTSAVTSESSTANPPIGSQTPTNTDVPADWQSGRDVAEAYARNRITNSFVRAKDKR